MADTKVAHVSGQDDFNAKILKSDKAVLVDFYADWCGPCKMAAPIMDRLSVELDGKASIVKIDVDDPENQAISQQFGIMSIPTVIAFRNGEAVSKQIGFIGEDGYRGMIEQAMKAKAN